MSRAVFSFCLVHFTNADYNISSDKSDASGEVLHVGKLTSETSWLLNVSTPNLYQIRDAKFQELATSHSMGHFS